MFVLCRYLIPSSSRIFLPRNILLHYLGTPVFSTFLINMHGLEVDLLYWIMGWLDKGGVLYLYICSLSFSARQCSTPPSSNLAFYLHFVPFLLSMIPFHNLIFFQVQYGIFRLPNLFHKISVIVVHLSPLLCLAFSLSPASLGCFQ